MVIDLHQTVILSDTFCPVFLTLSYLEIYLTSSSFGWYRYEWVKEGDIYSMKEQVWQYLHQLNRTRRRPSWDVLSPRDWEPTKVRGYALSLSTNGSEISHNALGWECDVPWGYLRWSRSKACVTFNPRPLSHSNQSESSKVGGTHILTPLVSADSLAKIVNLC